jgi:uncharacterized protein YjbI with pentapeptide repeats
MNWPIVIKSAVAALAAAVLLGVWWLWWRLPKRQVDRLRLTIRDPKARADIEDNLRKTIGQLIGGAAVVIGAGLAYLQFTQQQQASQQQFLQQQQASRDLLISNQVAKGFEQLGSGKVVVRLGGIYALEGVMNNSEQYHKPVLEALSAFVRNGTSTETGDEPPAADIQAALLVIGRRAAIGTGSPDLSHAHIPKADLKHTDLRDANLSGTILRGAELSHTNLRHANLIDANLSGANLSGASLTVATSLNNPTVTPGLMLFDMSGDPADLSDATLFNADLSGANLSNANLSRANLSANLTKADLLNANLSNADLANANLSNANLSIANLSGADLRGANLSGANLKGADLRGANLTVANLSGATVTQAQFDQACGTYVKLDPGLTIKPCHD